MMRKLLGVLAILAGLAVVGLTYYLLWFSAGMPHGRMINGREEWSALALSVSVVAVLLWLGFHLLRNPTDE